jgi:hypothetical protein
MTERSASLFVREEESVRLEVLTTPEGVHLVIEGPGLASSRFDFPPGTAVESFRKEYERKLIEDGFRLQAVDRRSAGRGTRSASDRRRGD